MEKKEWTTLSLEVLEVSETMAGYGVSKLDFTYVDGKLVDIDVYDS
ncbi:paeninodin family lasso peptide [Paenibacillus soyae]|uniref:Paeninodin family lasso peptide n=1 Tax=Paenibacillus soyae TaxID=2969249 RepID=A0A9X2S983_9BACL|nr:paeninodin family lasso peptide [Paenibacillus soyae]MCR2803258.1 paeninodin family lasso peptide [Paenibacillus soyae]